MANNEHVNKVVYGNQTLIDLSSDTVTPQGLQAGLTAHDASGALITGTNEGGDGEGYVWQDAQGYVHLSDNQGTDFVANIIADAYDSTSTYEVGDYCSYNGLFYRCTTAISTAEAWNANHWTQTVVVDEMGSGSGGTSPYDMIVTITLNDVDPDFTITGVADVTLEDALDALNDGKFVGFRVIWDSGHVEDPNNVSIVYYGSYEDDPDIILMSSYGDSDNDRIYFSSYNIEWLLEYNDEESIVADIATYSESLPSPTYADEGKILKVVNEEWEIVNETIQDISGKTDKVSGATNGNFAALDSNGNLTDSGHKHSDYLTSHQDISGKTDKVTGATSGNFASLDSTGNLTDSGHKHSDYLTSHQDISGKADKVTNATNGHFAALDSNGNLIDSGHQHSDYLTQHQDISGKLDAPSVAGTAGQVLGLNSSNATVWVDQPESLYDIVVRVLHLSYWDDDLNDQVDTYEKSATFEEVYAAHQQGKNIILNYQECFDSTRSYINNLGCFTLAEAYGDQLIFHQTDFITTYDYSTNSVEVNGTIYYYLTWYADQTESEGDPEHFDLITPQIAILDYDDVFDTIVASATLTPSSYSTNVTTSYTYGEKSEYVYTGYQITSGSEEYFTSPVTITPSGASYTPQFTVATATAPTASVTIEIYMTRKH